MKIYLIFGCLIQIVASACPNGWLTHDGNCYHFSHDVESWTGAYTMCKILGGQLLEVDGAAEDQFVSSQVKISGRNYWIGLTDVNEEGSWIWMTSMAKLSYSNWTPGEPTALNVYKEIENCVLIYKNNGMWNDSPCSHTNFYICEKSDGVSEIIG